MRDGPIFLYDTTLLAPRPGRIIWGGRDGCIVRPLEGAQVESNAFDVSADGRRVFGSAIAYLAHIGSRPEGYDSVSVQNAVYSPEPVRVLRGAFSVAHPAEGFLPVDTYEVFMRAGPRVTLRELVLGDGDPAHLDRVLAGYARQRDEAASRRMERENERVELAAEHGLRL